VEDVVPTWPASNWTHEFLCSTYGQERVAMIGVRVWIAIIIVITNFISQRMHKTDCSTISELFRAEVRSLLRLSVLFSIFDHVILCRGSVAEWLRCWTQAQNGLGSNHSRDAVG